VLAGDPYPGRVPPAAVLFDLYDTLVEGSWDDWHRWLAGQLGVAPSVLRAAYDRTRPARSVGAYSDEQADLRAVLEAAGVESPAPALVAELVAAERAFMTSNVHLHDDALPVLRALRDRGVPTALVSNCSHNTTAVVERLGLANELDAVVLSFAVGASKPQPAIYRLALQRLGDPPPGDTVFVDDQPGFCDGAAALGIATRLIARTGEPSQADGHRVIRSLAELLDAP
jgi:putative hydrolase of the HAD superfamily